MTTTSNLINLQSLIDLSAALNASDDELFILNTSLLSVMGKLRTFKACALQPIQSGEQLLWQCVATKGMKLPQEPFTLDFDAMRPFDPTNTDDGVFVDTGIQLVQPITAQASEEHLALLCFGANLTKIPYTDEEQQYISLVGSITANALMNARNMRSLRQTGAYLERKNQLLTTLFEINREFAALLNKDDIIKFLTLRLMGQLAVTRFAVIIKNPAMPHGFDIAVNRLKMTHEQACSLVESFTMDTEQAMMRCSEVIGDCVLASPMTTQNEVRGLLLVGEKMNKQPFTLEERNFLEALGSTAMTALENARLFQEELEKKRLEDELNLARTIQKGLLPQELPHIQGFDVAGMSVSSKQIGGDYYDVFPINATPDGQTDEWILVIADVSGKGTPAALLMANTQAALRALALVDIPLPEMVSRINNLLFANTSSDKFVTFFCGKLNTREKTFTFCNAGHNPPLLLRSNGDLELLSDGGLILGIMETLVPYEEKTITLNTGDVLVCFTDGVSEALNEQHEEFTDERLETSLRAYANASTQEIITRITADVQVHAGAAPQSDDITMLILKSLL
jgi:sigma-B regulation protein RsbU (phosphoserine phosphatase)